MAHVRYLARRSRIRRTAWTTGTMVASCAATSALATRQSGIHDSSGANTNLHDPVISFTPSESVTAPGSTNVHADSQSPLSLSFSGSDDAAHTQGPTANPAPMRAAFAKRSRRLSQVFDAVGSSFSARNAIQLPLSSSNASEVERPRNASICAFRSATFCSAVSMASARLKSRFALSFDSF